MLRYLVAIVVAATASIAAETRVANAQDAPGILQTMADRQQQRWSEAEDYTITVEMQEAGGLQTPMYFEQVTVDGDATFQMISPARNQRNMQILLRFSAAAAGTGLTLVNTRKEQEPN